MNRFMAELTQVSSATPRDASASHALGVGSYYVLQTSNPSQSHWTAWNGWNDNLKTTQAQIYLGQFLVQVLSLAAFRAIPQTFFVQGSDLFLHLEKQPAQYLSFEASLLIMQRFSSGPHSNIQDTTYPFQSGASAVCLPRLDIPSAPSLLGDTSGGSTIYSTFDIKLNNDDGLYDRNILHWLNTPCILKKSEKHKPFLEDFSIIRRGLIEDVSVSEKEVTIKVADALRTLTSPITQSLTLEQFPHLPKDKINTPMPIGYGSLKNVPLIPIDRAKGQEIRHYLALDPRFLSKVTHVYDKDGKSFTFRYDSNGIISSEAKTEKGEAVDLKSADVIGKNVCRLGQVAIDLLDAAGFLFLDEFWDIAEARAYADSSPPISFYGKDGDLKKALNHLMKSDLAYVIQLPDGRLTLRKTGATYAKHTIEPWKLTKFPTKRFNNAKKNFASSVVVHFDLKANTGKATQSVRVVMEKNKPLDIYYKDKEYSFQTCLTQPSDAKNVADRLLADLSHMKEEMEIAVGGDISFIKLLDTVVLSPIITASRTFSDVESWVVQGINAAQETLTLKEI